MIKQIFFIVLGNFLMYLLGTIGSGYFLEMSDFLLTTCHYYAVLVEILLIAIIHFCARNCLIVLFLSTLALGLQNGITSNISNNTLRSTHFTGMITDVGICMGQMMKTHKFRIWVASLLSFFRRFVCINMYTIYFPICLSCEYCCLDNSIGKLENFFSSWLINYL